VTSVSSWQWSDGTGIFDRLDVASPTALPTSRFDVLRGCILARSSIKILAPPRSRVTALFLVFGVGMLSTLRETPPCGLPSSKSSPNGYFDAQEENAGRVAREPARRTQPDSCGGALLRSTMPRDRLERGDTRRSTRVYIIRRFAEHRRSPPYQPLELRPASLDDLGLSGAENLVATVCNYGTGRECRFQPQWVVSLTCLTTSSICTVPIAHRGRWTNTNAMPAARKVIVDLRGSPQGATLSII